MNPLHVHWLVSLAGAVLFFLAGHRVAGKRALAPSPPAPKEAPELEATRLALEQRLGELGLEAERQRRLALEARAAQEAAEASAHVAASERGGLTVELEKVRKLAAEAQVARAAAEARAQAAGAEVRLLEGEVDKQRRLLAEVRQAHEEATRAAQDAGLESRRLRDESAKLTGVQEQLRVLEQDITQLQQRRSKLEDQLAQAKATLEKSAHRGAGLDREIERLRESLAAAERRAALADERAAAADTARASAAREQTELTTKLRRLAEERLELAMRVDALELGKQEAAALREERSALLERLAHAEAAIADLPDPRKFAELQHDRALLTAVDRARNEELSRLRDENTALKAEAIEASGLRRELHELEGELDRLRARPTATGSGVRAIEPVLPPPAALDERALQGFIGRLPDRLQAAVITDTQGLVVAGRGELTEPLGAFAAFLVGDARRACGILPIGALAWVRLRDDRGLTITARPCAGAHAELVFATLEEDGGEEALGARTIAPMAPPSMSVETSSAAGG